MISSLRTILALLVLLATIAVGSAQQPEPVVKPGEASPAASQPAPPPKYPEPETVRTAMKNAAAFFRSNLSVAGGYAWSWPTDLSESQGENRSAPSLIMIQPPGTPSVGQTMLEAYIATGDPLFLAGAREAADALMWCQLASGGWSADFDFAPQTARRYHYRRDVDAGDTEPGKRSARSSLDDNKTQSALRFLFHLDQETGGKDPRLSHAVSYGWKGLLTAQAPNGGWPQHFAGPADPDAPVTKASFPVEWSPTFPAIDYTRHYTLNDNNLQNVMRLLLEAHELFPAGSHYLDAAKRLGDFLLLAQMPEPQPAWAQQYDRDMHPTWARKFEPPAICSIESLGAMRALHELWLVTGDNKYIDSLAAALNWFERSRLAGKDEPTWARFYELETNQPLYCKAGTYEVTYDDSDLPTHYGFQVSGSMARSLEKMRNAISEPRDEQLAHRQRDAERASPSSEKGWSDRARKLASSARNALKEQNKQGYWIEDDLIDAGEFVRHMRALTDYLEAAEDGAATFEAVRQNEASPSPPD
jgi:PelA/Pel-15E family pectate lyase